MWIGGAARPALVRSGRRKVDDLDRTGGRQPGSPERDAPRAQVVDGLASALPATGELVVSHGDFSPRNVLLTPAGVSLIDFERLQLAAPERDISYWGAWTWVTMLTCGEQLTWQVANDLAAAYTHVRPLPAAVVPPWPFYRAVALLRVAHGWSALQAAPQTSALLLRESLRLLAAEPG